MPKFFYIHRQLNFRFFSIIRHYNRFNFTRINKSIYLLECSISSAILSTQVIARVRNPQSLRPHRSSNRASNNPAGSSVAQAIENDTNTELWISFNEYTWPSNEITVKHLQDSIGYLSRFFSQHKLVSYTCQNATRRIVFLANRGVLNRSSSVADSWILSDASMLLCKNLFRE